MKRNRSLRQGVQRSGGARRIGKNIEIDGWRRSAGCNETIENFLNAFIAHLHLREKLVGRIKTKTPRQSLTSHRIVRNGMCLPFRFDLKAMFDASQKPIRFVQNANLRGRQQFELRDGTQSLQCALLLQERLLRPMNELQRLNDKLDFADAAGAQFNV